MTTAALPLIGVTGDTLPGGESVFYKVGDKYILSVVEAAGCLAVMIPPIADRLHMEALLDKLDGVVFTGSPANIEPHHYGAESQQTEDQLDRGRDATNLPLLRKVLDRGMPVFCICRGHQELNVIHGGTMHQYVHDIEGNNDHRADTSIPFDDRYTPKHPIKIQPGGILEKLNGGLDDVWVNTVHEQAVDKLGEGLQVEATAEDGVIEAISVKDYPNFMVSVQWHPEHVRALEVPLNKKMFEAFGNAARDWMSKRG
ncbi:gamma-glutamyl-gamma-aminobutyrate hydrolase family protein [Curvivirga sp.]|uniref:gamma-glutamyl-gamma-aminobutyrate hydrolase family protein n=1 Tax=Curvivirga sp. TaxID=2856848 RepID=UPI003B5C3F6E